MTWPKASPPSSDGIDWQMGSAFMQTVYSVFRCDPPVLLLYSIFSCKKFSFGIDYKEPPFIGLYSLRQGAVPLSPASLSAFFSSQSETVATNLPNYIVPTPSPTTPSYIFNTSVPISVVVATDLATSTYSPLIEQVANGVSQKLVVTALPEATPTPTLETLILTDASGVVHTTVSPLPISTVILGRPPGYNSGGSTIRPHNMMAMLAVVSLVFSLSTGFFVDLLLPFNLLAFAHSHIDSYR